MTRVDVLTVLDRSARGYALDEDECRETIAARALVADLLTDARALIGARVAAHDPALNRAAFAQARKRVNLAELALAGVLARIAP